MKEHKKGIHGEPDATCEKSIQQIQSILKSNHNVTN